MNCLHLIACLLFLSGSQHVNGFPQASSSAIGNQPLAAEAKSAPALEVKGVTEEHGPAWISAIDERNAPLVDDKTNTTQNPNSTTTDKPAPPSNGTSDSTTSSTTSTTTTTTSSDAPATTVPTPPPTTKATPTTPTTTSTAPPTTSPSTTTTTVAPTTPSSTTTEKPTTVTSTSTTTTSTAAPEISRRFDGPSFIGGIVFALGFTAIAFVAWKFYKARTERNYHTL